MKDLKELNEPELWKDLIGYEGVYEISDLGRIRRIKANGTFNYLNASDCNGYENVTICVRKLKKSKSFLVHTLVAENWLGDRQDGMNWIKHIDGNKKNNRAKNLQWTNRRQTMKDHFVNGGYSKLKNVKGIKYFRIKNSVVISMYETPAEIMTEFGWTYYQLLKHIRDFSEDEQGCTWLKLALG